MRKLLSRSVLGSVFLTLFSNPFVPGLYLVMLLAPAGTLFEFEREGTSPFFYISIFFTLLFYFCLIAGLLWLWERIQALRRRKSR